MITKHLLRPERQRQIPPSFSWVDHRLVRLNYFSRCDCPGLALYLFLVTVADAQGLSYYSDPALGRYLRLDPTRLAQARAQLQAADLIAYQKPLYQVLSLPDPVRVAVPTGERRSGGAQSVAEILQRICTGGTHD